MSAYAELAVATNFSFLRGASHAHEMVATADELGCFAIGIADRNSFAGVVRAYDEAKNRAIKHVVGTRLVTVDGFEVLAYPTDRAAYGRLCRLLTAGNLKAKKGECHLTFEQILGSSEGQMLIALPPVELFARGSFPGRSAAHIDDVIPDCREAASPESIFTDSGYGFRAPRFDRPRNDGVTECRTAFHAAPRPGNEIQFSVRLSTLVRAAPGRTFLAGAHYHRGDEPRRLGLLAELGEQIGAPLVAVNDVFYHVPERRPLLDVLTCVREKCTIAEAGVRLAVNAERHLKSPAEMARLFARFPDAIARTVTIAKACTFSLSELKYEYPDEPVPEGKTAQQHLEDLTWAGARERYPKDKYPDGIPEDVAQRLHDELKLIAKLDYARYFLTVHDVVHYARTRDKEILCQGRGSAANSAVCFCLGITSVNPEKTKLLFARFISENRGEPPDIDVDFEH
ncbi:MAG: PHP domain-containing protein, partial [Xanthobacteraceae bacterium]